jgi:hypothetical protein
MTPTDFAFDRLRAANPFAPATAVDAEGLFERITSAEPVRTLPRSHRRFSRPVVALAVALALVAVLASTAFALSNWISSIIGPSEVNSEFAQAQSSLSLPPGYNWPSFNFPSNSVTSRGAGGSQAVTIAQTAWECYWLQSIRSHDIDAQRRANTALGGLMANNIVVAPSGASENWSPPQHAGKPIATFADDGGYQFKQRMYAQAAAGHPQLLEQSCRANAPPGWGK